MTVPVARMINTKLKDMNLYGAIIGKALYENKIELKEVLSLC